MQNTEIYSQTTESLFIGCTGLCYIHLFRWRFRFPSLHQLLLSGYHLQSLLALLPYPVKALEVVSEGVAYIVVSVFLCYV